jgi:hypothetical protein
MKMIYVKLLKNYIETFFNDEIDTGVKFIYATLLLYFRMDFLLFTSKAAGKNLVELYRKGHSF